MTDLIADLTADDVMSNTPWRITFERRAERMDPGHWLIDYEIPVHGGYQLAPVDEAAAAYVYPDEPRTIRLGNSMKRKFARAWMEEKVCEWLSHEVMHGVMFGIGEREAGLRFDRKNNRGTIGLSGMVDP